MNYSKAWGMVIATILSALLPLLTTGGITTVGWVNIALVGFGAINVAIVPDLDAGIGKFAKPAVAVAMAVLTLLVTVIDGGLTGAEIIQLVIAGLGAIGVVALPGPQHPLATAPLVDGAFKITRKE